MAGQPVQYCTVVYAFSQSELARQTALYALSQWALYRAVLSCWVVLVKVLLLRRDLSQPLFCVLANSFDP
jgi:hypothetical protein